MRGSSLVEMRGDDNSAADTVSGHKFTDSYICTAAFMVHNTYVPVLPYVQVQYVCMYSHQSTNQPGKVAKSTRGLLKRYEYFPVPVRT